MLRIEQDGARKEIANLVRYDRQLSSGLSQYAENGRWDKYVSFSRQWRRWGKRQTRNYPPACRGARRMGGGTSTSPFSDNGGDGESDRRTTILRPVAVRGEWVVGQVRLLLKTMAEMGKATDTQLSSGLSQYAENGWWGRTPPSQDNDGDGERNSSIR